MTGEQKKWLDRNPAYEMIGQVGGMVRYVNQSFIGPDGKSQAKRTVAEQPPSGFLHVGIKKIIEPGKMPDPRADMSGTRRV